MTTKPLGSVTKAFNAELVRRDFPILNRTIQGAPLVYLDNAASSQKPIQVLDSMDHYYRHTHANVHRGVHTLSFLNLLDVALHLLLVHLMNPKSSSLAALLNL